MISVVLTVLAVGLLQLLVPVWWWIILIPLVAGFLSTGFTWRTVLGHGAGIALLWMGVSLFQWFSAGTRIVTRIQTLMGLPSPWLLVLVTTLLALIISGLATYTGLTLRSVLVQEKQLR